MITSDLIASQSSTIAENQSIDLMNVIPPLTKLFLANLGYAGYIKDTARERAACYEVLES